MRGAEVRRQLSSAAEIDALASELERGGAREARATWLVGIVGILIGAAGLLLLPAGFVMGLPLALLGGVVLGFTRRNARNLRLDALLRGARNELALGHLVRAKELVVRVERRTKQRAYRRAVAAFEGTIALRRGNLTEAIAGYDRALRIPPDRLASLDRFAAFQARAARALAYAMRGDDIAARADIEAVRAAARADFGWRVVVSDVSLGGALAQVALAEILLAGKKSDTAALRELIARHRALVSERATPRERVLLRAMERRARAGAGSVYRSVVAPETKEETDDPPINEWVARVAPEAAQFVRAERKEAAPPVEFQAAPPRARAPLGAATRPAKWQTTKTRLVAIWFLLVLGAFAAWQFFSFDSYGTAARHGGPDPDFATAALDPLIETLLFTIALVAILLFARLVGLYRQTHRLNAAYRRQIFDHGIENADFADVPVEVNPLLAAMRSLTLARVAYRRAAFTSALRHSEEGLARLGRFSRWAGFGEVTPLLSVERAAALAALGRAEDARAEVADLPVAFSHRAVAAVRVGLLSAVKEKDKARALAVAESITDDLPLDLHTELVADVVRATASASGIGLADLERVRRDAGAPAERAFLNALAPELLDELEPRDAHVGITRELEAEVEASAEAESPSLPDARALVSR